MCDHDHMVRAIALSRTQMEQGQGGPFGAVIVRDGEIIAEGWNQVTSANDPTAHAEVVAIRRACETLGSFSLDGCTIYTSCEPCPMCLGAIYWARIKEIRYANTRADAARIGFDDSLIYDEVPKEPSARMIPTVHQPSDAARAVFDDWANKPDKIEY